MGGAFQQQQQPQPQPFASQQSQFMAQPVTYQSLAAQPMTSQPSPMSSQLAIYRPPLQQTFAQQTFAQPAQVRLD